MEESAGSADMDVESEQALAQAPLSRRIIYTGGIQLRVEEPRQLLQTMGSLAARYGGYVSNANVFELYDGTYQASVQLRIQADQFDVALNELRELSIEVLNETRSTQDVTERYVDLEARIENLERTEEELQLLLTEAREQGGETEDILAVYRELTSIRGEIESLQGQLNVLADAVTLATINVELVPPEAEVRLLDEEWSLTRTVREALRDLTDGLQSLVSATVYFLIAVAPRLAIMAVLLYGLYRVALWLRDRLRRPAPPAPPVTPPTSTE